MGPTVKTLVRLKLPIEAQPDPLLTLLKDEIVQDNFHCRAILRDRVQHCFYPFFKNFSLVFHPSFLLFIHFASIFPPFFMHFFSEFLNH